MKAREEWIESLKTDLESVERKGRLRMLKTSSASLDFASNDYLSLNSSGTLLEILKTTAAGWQESVGSTGSRLLRGHYEAFERAEAEFTKFCGAASSLLFHSGYAANVGVIETLISSDDTVFCDRLCHATILDGIRLAGARRYYFHHNDFTHLRDLLGKRERRGRTWIITESIFSMDGDSPDLRALAEIADEFGAMLYLDEAHAIGVRGNTGAGLAHEAGLSERFDVIVFPCGKAPGLMGAFVCGAPELRATLINRCRSFIFSTSQPPILAEILRQTVQRITVMQHERNHLHLLSEHLRASLARGGFDAGKSNSQIVPVIVGKEDTAMFWMNELLSAGIDARAIRPPSVPEGTSRLRINLQAGHSIEDVNRLLKELYRLSGKSFESK